VTHGVPKKMKFEMVGESEGSCVGSFDTLLAGFYTI